MRQLHLELEPRPSARPRPDDNELARAMLAAQVAEAHKRRTGWYSAEMAREFPVPNCNKRNRTRQTKETE